MLKSLKSFIWLYNFRCNTKKLKNAYAYVLYTAQKDFLRQQKNDNLSDYDCEEIIFYLNAMQNAYQKMTQISFIQAATHKHEEYLAYIHLFKQNMHKCNALLMKATRKELAKLQSDIDFLLHDKTCQLTKKLSSSEQFVFTKAEQLLISILKAIDEENWRRFSTDKRQLNIILSNISLPRYKHIFRQIDIARRNELKLKSSAN